jgi:hypothetical protein
MDVYMCVNVYIYICMYVYMKIYLYEFKNYPIYLHQSLMMIVPINDDIFIYLFIYYLLLIILGDIHLPRVELFLQEIGRREPLYFQQRAIDEKDSKYGDDDYAEHYYKTKFGN